MIPQRYSEHLYALMRIVFGAMYLSAGLMKLGVFGGPRMPLNSLAGAAMVLETVLGVLITVGLFTRPAAFIASGQMAAAYFIGHQSKGLLPIQNQGLPAVLLCFGFLYIAARGAGMCSADHARKR
jgi:putative oxidoreductase